MAIARDREREVGAARMGALPKEAAVVGSDAQRAVEQPRDDRQVFLPRPLAGGQYRADAGGNSYNAACYAALAAAG